MRYGFYLPTRGRTATETLSTLVGRAEALGFHSVVIADHVVFPAAIASRYPYTGAAERRPFSGSPAQILDDIDEYARLGVRELIVDFRSEDLDESLDRMERFAALGKPSATD